LAKSRVDITQCQHGKFSAACKHGNFSYPSGFWHCYIIKKYKTFFPYWYIVISTLVEVGKTRNCMIVYHIYCISYCISNCISALRASCFHTISRFPNSTRVDITVYQHGKCFIFVNWQIVLLTSQSPKLSLLSKIDVNI
jgi:hypothetical protein